MFRTFGILHFDWMQIFFANTWTCSGEKLGNALICSNLILVREYFDLFGKRQSCSEIKKWLHLTQSRTGLVRELVFVREQISVGKRGLFEKATCSEIQLVREQVLIANNYTYSRTSSHFRTTFYFRTRFYSRTSMVVRERVIISERTCISEQVTPFPNMFLFANKYCYSRTKFSTRTRFCSGISTCSICDLFGIDLVRK